MLNKASPELLIIVSRGGVVVGTSDCQVREPMFEYSSKL